MINKLYKIEESCKGFDSNACLVCRKDNLAVKIFEQLQQYIAKEKQSVSPKPPYYAALNYADDELPHIRNYLKRGFIEIDNNLAENAIRPFALGRRNWLFIMSENGAKASASLYSILITAKANGIEPAEYLTHLIRKPPLCEKLEDYEALRPS